ncbi:DUF3558 family protein [Nocardia sp. NPDC050717]|uniref:DUF3558 family protein n=1 Tax=Nocardia sp. NPDC050717 TaxID=3157221 RepID=UPI0033F044FF
MAHVPAHGISEPTLAAAWRGPLKRRAAILGAAICATIALCGCGGKNDNLASDTTTSSAAPTILVTVEPPETDPDEKPVGADPCTISDAAIVRAGFDPATRERSEAEISSSLSTSRGCTFGKFGMESGEPKPTGRLDILTTSRPLAEARERGESIVSTAPINGVDAVVYRASKAAEGVYNSCTAVLATPQGSLEIQVGEYPTTAPDGTLRADARSSCAVATEVARIAAEALGIG